MDNFNQLTDERNALQGRNDTLLSSSGTEDPDTKKKLEENKQALLKALGLAKPKQQTVVQNKNARV